MKWQEYQEAVGKLYDRLAQQGKLGRKLRLPDRHTGTSRQVDVWWQIQLAGHRLNVLIDAKFRRSRVDIKDVEEVLSLADAVGAHKSVLVAPHGWTPAAKAKAETAGLDLRLLTVEDALRLLDIKYWLLCPLCQNDCIIMDQGGLPVTFNGEDVWCVGGRCRECKGAAAECSRCHERVILEPGSTADCTCGHGWSNSDGRIFFRYGPIPAVSIALDQWGIGGDAA